MRSPFPRRALAALVAIWFTIAAAEQWALHRCPVHDGPAPAGQTAHHAGAHDDAAPEPGEHCCTCLGQCAAAAAVAVPMASAAVVAAPVEAHGAALHLEGIVPLPTPHSQPFQIGPPQSA